MTDSVVSQTYLTAASADPEGIAWDPIEAQFWITEPAANPVVSFNHAITGSAVAPITMNPGRADDGETGEQAFRRLGASVEISFSMRQIRSSGRALQVLGVRGKPVKSALRGYVFFRCPAITSGENAAADALAQAIGRCDADGIRDAIERGASLTVLPDTSVSPLLSALYKDGRCEPGRWKVCLEVLLTSGCPIDGTPQGDPPILDCVRHYVPDRQVLMMATFLVAHGADVNARSPHGLTALFESVVHGRRGIVRFLREHGADPNTVTEQGVSTIEWLRGRLRGRFDSRDEVRYAEMLELLTGSSAV